MGRNRSQALVVRGDKILMVKHIMDGRYFYCLPGGGIDPGETPDVAALRELKEEACVDGKIIQKTMVRYKPDKESEIHTYWIEIADNAVPAPGVDPELAPDKQTIVDAVWMSLDEMSQLDQIYLWSSGLQSIPHFYASLQKMKK